LNLLVWEAEPELRFGQFVKPKLIKERAINRLNTAQADLFIFYPPLLQ
jgi:hypothetical protein